LAEGLIAEFAYPCPPYCSKPNGLNSWYYSTFI
jgi:hypothetical protein